MTALANGHGNPAAVMSRLTAIENDLATRQEEYEQAADDRARLTRDWDHRFALCMRLAKGSNAETRKASALVAAIEQDDLYERLADAEGRFEALRVVMRTLETRSVIGMGVLKAMGRS